MWRRDGPNAVYSIARAAADNLLNSTQFGAITPKYPRPDGAFA
ncbi:hypothetical protein [Ferrimonas balearica]|nr:hypothetical protein [Ferrimonas balearica]